MKKRRSFRLLLLLLSFPWLPNGVFAEDDAKPPGQDKFIPSYFREDGECYLVCEYAAEIHTHGIKSLAANGERELHVKAVVVDVAKGRLVRGDKLEYIQYWGSEEESAKEVQKRTGNLAFVFLVKAGNGQHFFDPQDPQSRRNYSKGFADGLFKFYAAKRK